MNRLLKIIANGNERTVKAKKNILYSLFFKGGSLFISLLILPLTLHYLNPERYGIWVTLSSILAWFSLCDIGIGNGLKNRLSEALAREDYDKARKYVSTAYFAFGGFLCFLTCILLFINNQLSWPSILSCSNVYDSELRNLMAVIILSFGLQLLLSLLLNIFDAIQKSYFSSIVTFFTNVVSLFTVFSISKYGDGSLILLGSFYSFSSVVILLISSFLFFKGKYAFLCPNLRFFQLSLLKSIFSLGVKFFIIQIVAIILFQTNNLIISYNWGPTEVAPYNIIMKYYSIIFIGVSFVMVPLWPAFTEAYVKNDFQWMKNTMKFVNHLLLIVICSTVILALFSSNILDFWLGNSVVVSSSLVVLGAIYVILQSLNNVYGIFLNGVGKITISLIISCFSSIANLVLSIYLVRKIGVEGALLANIIVMGLGSITGIYQTYLILNKKAYGLWSH